MLRRKSASGGGRARHRCDGGASLAVEYGTNMYGTNICLGEWELIQSSFPHNAVMDLSWQCKKCDREGEKGREGDQVGFGALIYLYISTTYT